MLGYYNKFKALESKGTPVRVAIIGIGQMGRALVSQLVKLPGIQPTVLVDHKHSRAISALSQHQHCKYTYVENIEDAERTIADGGIAICEDMSLATNNRYVDIVIDATGSVTASVEISLSAIENKKHIILMTVEADATVGYILRKKAEKAGVMLTGMAGDEPGAIMELYEQARTMGLEVLVLGKGKNNPVEEGANPISCAEKAEKNKMNSYMLASFVDCTKTMIELAAVANATGLLPDVDGCHGVRAELGELTAVLSTKNEGGILSSYRVVEYIQGIAPGVFAIVTTDNAELREELKYLSMGDGPRYLLYRPYHLCSLEIPITIARIIFDRQASLWIEDKPIAEVVAVAKRNLRTGEELDRIGGFTSRGVLTTRKNALERGLLPIGLINNHTVVKGNIQKGEWLRLCDVELDAHSPVVKLWLEQNELLKA